MEIYTTREVIDELIDSPLQRVTAFIQSQQLLYILFRLKNLSNKGNDCSFIFINSG